jgi:transcription elongation factor GreA
MTKYPMTIEGAELLRAELKQLKSVDRPNVINAIAEARAHGDLRENAEYHAAKEQQSFIEGRINDIDSKLAQAQIIDINTIPQNGRVVFGVTVDLINLQDDTKVSYKIVGDDEADFKIGKISINSPIARALISKQEGDVVVVFAPNGEIEYQLDQVRYI